jgi:cytochrome c-type biogenesis protein
VNAWWEQVAAAFQQAVLSGPMLAALPVALVAGLVSFASPCVLPLVPGYLGYVGGMAGTDAVGAAGGARSRGRTATRAPGRSRLLLGVALFVAGFTAVFVTLSVAFAWLGLALLPWQDVITRLLGVVVILLGLGFLGAVPFLQRERRMHVSPRAGLWGAPLLGAAFGLGWAPCIGPTLGAVLSLSWGGADPLRGAILAIAYCVGLGLPFLLIALAFERSTRALAFLRRHRAAIMRVGGALLVAVGLALVTGLWGTWVAQLQGVVDGFVTVV